MIVADTSAWVEYLRATGSAVNHRLREALTDGELATTEAVVGEVLAGAVSQGHRAALREELEALPVLSLGGLAGFVAAGDLYAHCRRRGVAVRSFTDCLIAVPALHAGASVLHRDRDFAAIASVTGLDLVPV